MRYAAFIAFVSPVVSLGEDALAGSTGLRNVGPSPIHARCYVICNRRNGAELTFLITLLYTPLVVGTNFISFFADNHSLYS